MAATGEGEVAFAQEHPYGEPAQYIRGNLWMFEPRGGVWAGVFIHGGAIKLEISGTPVSFPRIEPPTYIEGYGDWYYRPAIEKVWRITVRLTADGQERTFRGYTGPGEDPDNWLNLPFALWYDWDYRRANGGFSIPEPGPNVNRATLVDSDPTVERSIGSNLSIGNVDPATGPDAYKGGMTIDEGGGAYFFFERIEWWRGYDDREGDENCPKVGPSCHS